MTCSGLTFFGLAATLTAAPGPSAPDPAPRRELTELSLEELMEVNVTV